MSPGHDAGKDLLARQKAAVERLRRELMGSDGSLDHSYFEEMDRELASFRHPLDNSDVVAACAFADLVYVGDFHAVPEYQRFTADLLKRLSFLVPRLALGIEFVYARQQRLLDARQDGELDDAAFMRKIHYREEWGYPWAGFGALLDRARSLEIPVHALDRPPRGGFQGLADRDEHAGRRIAALIQADPERKLVILFGESHLSRGHLPRRVKKRLKQAGLERREVTIFQNPDRIYWELIDENGVPPSAVQIDENTYSVFHTSPLAKYEAYRQIMERWKEDASSADEVDLSPAVHHLIEVLLGWLGIRADSYRLRHRAGWVEDLADAFPEVYSGPESRRLLRPVLQDHHRNDEEIAESENLLDKRGVLYESRSNTVFVQRYLPGRAAGEGARFLRAALTGRLFIPPETIAGDPAARAYGSAYNEALAYLGARLVDPASDYLSVDEMRMLAVSSGRGGALPGEDYLERIHWLEAHARFEDGGEETPPDALLEPMRRSRRFARELARDLGHRMGRVLLDAVREGKIDQRVLRHLFTTRFDPADAPALVTRYLRGELFAPPEE